MSTDKKHGHRRHNHGGMPQRFHFRARGTRVTLRRLRGETPRKLLKKPFYFQVPPLDEFSYGVAFSHTDFDTLGRGQFSRPGGRQLRTVSFSTLIVDSNAPYAVVHGGTAHDNKGLYEGITYHPIRVAHEMQALVNAGAPFTLVVKNSPLWGDHQDDLTMPVTLRTLTVTEKAGEVDARYLDLSFVEWRPQEVDRFGYGSRSHELPATVEVKDSGVCVELRAGGDPVKGKNRHEIGDAKKPATLRDLAKHFYGAASEWRVIAKANGLKKFPGDRALKHLPKRGHDERLLRIPDHKTGDHKGDGGGKGGPSHSFG